MKLRVVAEGRAPQRSESERLNVLLKNRAEHRAPDRPKTERSSGRSLFRERQNARAPKNRALERPGPDLNN